MRRFASFFQTSVAFLLHVLFAIPVSLTVELFAAYVVMRFESFSPIQFQPVWYNWIVWIGFVLGFLINSMMGQRTACFIWLMGAIWLAFGLSGIPIRDLFPTGPRPDETPIERLVTYVVFTIPIMNAFSYSIGATLGLALNRFWLREKEAAV